MYCEACGCEIGAPIDDVPLCSDCMDEQQSEKEIKVRKAIAKLWNKVDFQLDGVAIFTGVRL